MALPTAGQAGHDGIRFVFITVLVSQRLIFLYAQRAVKAAAQQFVAVIEPCLTVEVDVARDVFAAVEVAVVIVVGNLVVVDAAADFAVQLLLVFPFELVAVVVDAFLVVRHPVAIDFATVIRLQVTDLAAQLHTAFADNARADGGIQIGGKVEVVGQAQLKAV